MFNSLRDWFTHIMQMRAVRLHGSRVGWRIAPRYTQYLDKCQASFRGELPALGDLSIALEDFSRDGVASFWTPTTGNIAESILAKIRQRESDGESLWAERGVSGNSNYNGDAYRDFPQLEELFRGPLGAFLVNYYRANFKLFYASMYKSIRIGNAPSGSQLWHSDSGPGTCVNVMIYLNDVLDEGAGILHVLPWGLSKETFKQEQRAIRRSASERGLDLRSASRDMRRELLTDFYGRVIGASLLDKVRAPKGKAGLVVPFLNNTLHYGGYPDAGRERIAVVAHCYPAESPMDFERYRKHGASKSAPYPFDPTETF